MIGHLGWLSQRDSLGTALGSPLGKSLWCLVLQVERDCVKGLVFICVLHLSLGSSSWLWGPFWGLVGTLWGLLGTSVGSSLFVGTSGNLRGFSVVSGLRGIGFTPGVSET